MKRHIKFNVVRVDYIYHPEEIASGEKAFVIAGLDAGASTEFDEKDLPPCVPHMLHDALTRYGQGVFYLAENGQVYPQFRMEER